MGEGEIGESEENNLQSPFALKRTCLKSKCGHRRILVSELQRGIDTP